MEEEREGESPELGMYVREVAQNEKPDLDPLDPWRSVVATAGRSKLSSLHPRGITAHRLKKPASWLSRNVSEFFVELPVLFIHQAPHFSVWQRAPTRRFGPFGTGVARVNRTDVESMVRMSMNIHVMKIPDERGIGSLVHIGKVVTLRKPLVITKGGSNHPWPPARVAILPRMLRAGIIKQNV